MGLLKLQDSMMLKYGLTHAIESHSRSIEECIRNIEDAKLCITVGNNALDELEAAYQESDEDAKKHIDIKIDYINAKIVNFKSDLTFYEDNLVILKKLKELDYRKLHNISLRR